MVRRRSRDFALAALAALLLPSTAGASEDEYRLTEGIYTGFERTARGPGARVSVELRGGTAVIMDDARVTVATTTFAIHGPGGKDGRMNLKGQLDVGGAITRTGASGRQRRYAAKAAFAVWDDGRAALCFALPGFKGKDVRVPPGVSAPDPQTRCLDLARLRFTGPDFEGDIPPVPTKPWEGVGDACVEACIARSQAKAMTVDAIRADCVNACATAAPNGPALPR
jgi:hypothetical protein